MKLCSEHDPLVAELRRVQHEAKLFQSRYNRMAKAGKNPLIAKVNDEIRWRRLRLMELSFYHTECSACGMIKVYASNGLSPLRNVLKDCLASSTVERLTCNQ